MHGRIDAALIAWRLYTTSRTVQRVAARLGLTEHKPAGDLGDDAATVPRRPRATA